MVALERPWTILAMTNKTDLLDDGIQASKQTPASEIQEDKKMDFPYERSIYLKGIFAIVFVLSGFGFMIGLYLINISLKRSGESLRDHKKFPQSYKQSSLIKVKQGRTAALIALGIWIIEIGSYVIIYR